MTDETDNEDDDRETARERAVQSLLSGGERVAKGRQRPTNDPPDDC
ncbi:MAG: hypothetical protein ABEI99_00965 [Halobaculum sp.]